MNVNRRGLFGVLGGAAAAVGLKKAPVSSLSGDKFRNLAGVGKIAGRTYKVGKYGLADDAIEKSNIEKIAEGTRALLHVKTHGPPDHVVKRIEVRASERTVSIDLDLRAMRSLSLETRYRISRQREIERAKRRCVDDLQDTINMLVFNSEDTTKWLDAWL